MSIFQIHNQIIKEYKDFVTSFVNIRDERIKSFVSDKLKDGELWPSPLLQFNPSFKIEQSTEDIPNEILDDQVKSCFPGFQLYKHQLDAIEIGSKGKGFIVTSGTGSGKSLTFFATIFNHYFKNPSDKGVLALLVYPMNALVNSQKNEFNDYAKDYKNQTSNDFPITCGVYTGQETREEKESIISNPPTILMTNYVMLEYLMTRSHEKQLRDNILRNLKYVVYDELHTFRGRQGSDVAILNRRISASSTHEITFIGTSATMASGDDLSIEEEKKTIAKVGEKFFGSSFSTDQIVGETIERQFSEPEGSLDAVKKAFFTKIDPNASKEDFIKHPLSWWIEENVGIEAKEGRLIRRKPIEIEKFYSLLSETLDIEREKIEEYFDAYSNWLNNINIKLYSEGQRKQLLPFKLHQFIAQTGSVYVTLDGREDRKITLEAGRFINDPKTNNLKDIYPVVFSRDSGLDFLCVRLSQDQKVVRPREFDQGVYTEDDESDSDSGYIFFDFDEENQLWTQDDIDQLPDSFFSFSKSGKNIKRDYKDRIPRAIYLNNEGGYSDNKSDEFPTKAWYMSAPALLDPSSGLIFDGRRGEYSKFVRLSSEARSTSTTILNRESLNAIRNANLKAFEEKVLTFSDNVQDTALQTGHFNDFNRVVELRRALYQSLKKKSKIRLSELGTSIYEELHLSESNFSKNPPDDRGFKMGESDDEKAFKTLVYCRALEDLAYAWKVTLPNLEQVGLLRFSYEGLEQLCEHVGWSEVPGFNKLTSSRRFQILYVILDHFRSKFAIDHSTLGDTELNEVTQRIKNRINEDWGLSKSEELRKPISIILEKKPGQKQGNYISAGYQSGIKRYLQSIEELKPYTKNESDYFQFIDDLFSRLSSSFLRKSTKKIGQSSIDIYRLDLEKLIWELNDTSQIIENPIRLKRYKEKSDYHVNKYFRNLYSRDSKASSIDISRDHTGLVDKSERKKREEDFVKKKIQVLFCSPTMELGIDISALSLVMMRNAPPNPANYVQRSGRAGRSGQAALVLTYCAARSPHDQHYFKHKLDMVAGKVSPPTLNLENEELLKSHLQAMYLALVDLEEIEKPEPNGQQGIVQLIDANTYKLRSNIHDKLYLSNTQKEYLKEKFMLIIEGFSSDYDRWNKLVDMWISTCPSNFQDSLKRWIELHKKTSDRLNEISSKLNRGDAYIDKNQRFKNEREERILRRTKEKLEGIKRNNKDTESEFYIYRYLADEGFLPGYNFPLIPLRANLNKDGDPVIIQRPKQVAISEFGPGNIIYHGGSKYSVTKILKNDLSDHLQTADINKESGVLFLGSKNISTDVDPILKTPILERKRLGNLIEIDSVQAEPRDHISCEEEERRRYGYVVHNYISIDKESNQKSSEIELKLNDKPLISVKYYLSSTLYRILEEYRSRSNNDKEVHINSVTGDFLTKTTREYLHKEGNGNQDIVVRPYTKEITDILYLSPTVLLGLDSDGVITLQYALERGIALAFDMEEHEIASTLLGNADIPNIMFYENSEGSLGILKQIAERPELFKNVIKKAIEICFPEEEPEDKRILPASYENLLSYRNQLDHERINRWLIKDSLSNLLNSSITVHSMKQNNYEEHYSWLLQKRDRNSKMEKEFLDYLYMNGLRLPDDAQVNIPNIYVNVDFIYDSYIAVFIDGSVHDESRVQDDDHAKRDALIAAGFIVVHWHYSEKIESFVSNHSYIFKKVKS